MAKVTSKGQITIPVSIRRRLGINEGDKLLFIDGPDGVVMVNPDMLPAGQDADTLLDGASPHQSLKAPPRNGSAPPPPSKENTNIRAGGIPTASGNAEPRVKGLDVGALLDEIRSIGSKI